MFSLFRQLNSRLSETTLGSFSVLHLKRISAAVSPLKTPTAAVITDLVLRSINSEALAEALLSSSINWTPELVDTTLKRLWNHGPKALHFFHLLHRHPSYSHSASSFNHAVDIAARLRRYDTVTSLLHRMRSLRVGPTPKTFAIISERYVGAGKPDRAVKLFLSMHQHGCFQDLHSFNTILDVLCKARRVEKAYDLFKILKGRFRADVVSYNTIANGWCLIKRTPMALQVLKEMVKRGVNPNLITYNTMIKGYFRAGQLKEAWEFFLEMKKRKCEIDVVTYTTLVHGFGVAGEIKRSRKVFDEMTKEGILPSVATYDALIQVLCKKDNVENAISVYQDMLRKGYVPNVTTYNLVIRGLCHAGQMERAVELMGRMKSDGCDPNVQTYNIVIRYHCDSGEIDKGLELFEEMVLVGCLPNLDSYNVLISAMFLRKKADDLLMAGKLLIEMVGRGFMPRKLMFGRVVDGLLLTGNQEFSRQILRLQSSSNRLSRHFRL